MSTAETSPQTPHQILVGNKTSPYVRRFRLWLHGRLDYELKVVDFLGNPDDAAYLKRFSPLNKIPIWVDGEKKIFESRVIANYLIAKHAWTPLTLDENNILSMSDAANDTVINLFLLRRSGLNIDGANSYIDRQKERLTTLFQALEPWAKSRDVKNPAHWNYVSSSLFSFIDWAEFREMVDLSPYPGLRDFVARFSSKPGVVETSPRA